MASAKLNHDLSGMVTLNLHWRNGGRTGIYRIPEALNVLPAETSTEPVQAIKSDSKVNTGSFKGYAAVYAKGHEGKRLRAKIGNDWVIVPSLASSFERITDFTGAGVDISVRIYIDRVLIDTINLTTK